MPQIIQIIRKGNRFNRALMNGLISYWTFNETSGNAADQVGGNTLTNNGGATYSAGKINNGVNLVPASSQYMSITNGAQVGLGIVGDMSVAMWYKPGTQVTSAYILASKFNYSTGNQRSYQFYYEDETGSGGYRLSIAISVDGVSAGVVRRNQTLTVGTFYHIVYLYTASTGVGEIYVNGTSIGSGSGLPTSIFNGTADFRIGDNHSTLYADGQIDETGVWNRVLSASEIATLYNGGTGRSYPF